PGAVGHVRRLRVLAVQRRHDDEPGYGVCEDPGAGGGHRAGGGSARERVMADREEEERLRAVALQNARSIVLARQRAEEALRKQADWLRVTLPSIGDA